jgi:hypothetical protein
LIGKHNLPYLFAWIPRLGEFETQVVEEKGSMGQ